MSTYTDLHNRVKETINVDFTTRISPQEVHLLNPNNAYCGVFKGKVIAIDSLISGGLIVGATLSNVTIPGLGDVTKIAETINGLSNEVSAISSDLSLEISQTASDLSSEIDLLSANLSSDIDNLSDEVFSEMQIVEEAIRSEIDNLSDDLSAEISSLGESLNAKVDKLSDDLSSDIADLSANLTDHIQELSDDLSNDIADLSASLSIAIEDLSVVLEDKIDTISSDLSDAVDALSTDLSTEISSLDDRTSEAIAKLCVDLSSEISSKIGVIPVASTDALGGIKIGYNSVSSHYYAVQLDDESKAYVNVPWTDVAIESAWYDHDTNQIVIRFNDSLHDEISVNIGQLVDVYSAGEGLGLSSHEFYVTADYALSGDVSSEIASLSDDLSNDIEKLSADLSVEISALGDASAKIDKLSSDLSSDIDSLSSNLSAEISSKTSIHVTDPVTGEDNELVSDLSIVKLTDMDYYQKIVDQTLQPDTLYIVSSDGINAYERRIVNVARPTVSSDAATKAYVDEHSSGITGEYLPLSGGTLSGSVSILGNDDLTIKIGESSDSSLIIKREGFSLDGTKILKIPTTISASTTIATTLDLTKKLDATEFSSVSSSFAISNELSNTYYSKTEIDSKLSTAGKVKTVNGISSDDSGNIELSTSSLCNDVGFVTSADLSVKTTVKVTPDYSEDLSSIEVFKVKKVTDEQYYAEVMAGNASPDTLYVISSSIVNSYGRRVAYVAEPTVSSDAATKNYVDTAIESVKIPDTYKTYDATVSSLSNSGYATSAATASSISKLSSDLSGDIDALSVALSTEISALNGAATTKIQKLSADLSAEISALDLSATTKIQKLSSDLSNDIVTLSADLSAEISSKTSIHVTDPVTGEDNQTVTDLSIIKLTDMDYYQKIVDGKIEPDTLYIVSSENVNAYERRVVNVGAPTVSSDAATKNYVDSEVGKINVPTRVTQLSNDANFISAVPLASTDKLGGMKIGFESGNHNYAVQLSNEVAYVNVPWVDTAVSSAKYDPDTKQIVLVINTIPKATELSVDVSDLVDTYTAGEGLKLENNKFSVSADYALSGDVSSEIASLSDDLSNDIEKLSVDLSNEISALDVSAVAKIQKLSADLSNDIIKLSVALSTEISAIDVSSVAKIQKLSSDLSNDIDTLSTSLSNEVSAEIHKLSDDLSGDIITLSVDLSNEISALDVSATTKIQKLSADLSAEISAKTATYLVDPDISGDTKILTDITIQKISDEDYYDLVALSATLSNVVYVVSSENLNAYGKRVVNVATPLSATDSATKGYVDAQVGSIVIPAPSAIAGVGLTGGADKLCVSYVTDDLSTVADGRLMINHENIATKSYVNQEVSGLTSANWFTNWLSGYVTEIIDRKIIDALSTEYPINDSTKS